MNKHLLAATISSVLLSGCALTDLYSEEAPQPAPQPVRERSALIGTLELQPSEIVDAPVTSLTAKELTESYKGLLSDITDPQLTSEIQQRIAVLEVMQGEHNQLNGLASDGKYYQSAIDSLNRFIEQNPDAEGVDKLLYQLAKAYDLEGEQAQSFATIERLISDHPDTEFMTEIQFRRAEMLFSQQDYFAALQSYKQVVEDKEDNPFYAIALYMQGWSYFKLEENEEALLSFNLILDDVLPQEHLPMVNSLLELNEFLDPQEKHLVAETLDIMTLIFASGEGADVLTEHYQRVGTRPYEFLSFELLANEYLEKQRYSDAISVYDAFINLNPNHQVAVLYAIKKIETYDKGGFPTQWREQRLAFVDTYQFVNSETGNNDYWLDKTDEVKAKVSPVLIDIIKENAQNAHANAQQQKRLLSEAGSDVQQSQVSLAYQEAINWYQTFLANFPEHEANATMRFYLAESFFETGDYRQAATYFEQVAYQSPMVEVNSEQATENATEVEQAEDDIFIVQDRRAEAAYALILTYDNMLAQSQSEQQTQLLLAEQLEYKALFIDGFSNDKRTLNVKVDIFQQYFKNNEYANAIMYAEESLNSKHALTEEQSQSALLVIAHSQFALGQFAQAEQSYEQVLGSIGQNDPRYKDMEDRLAAAIYKQGELALNSEPADLNQAIIHFARVVDTTPESDIRINAQFDMATHLLTLERYEEAIDQLVDFRTRFFDHKLSQQIPKKLAYAYQETEQWKESADYLKMSWSENPTSADTREMLWLAANTYLKAGDTSQALRSFRTYAHTYPQPFNEATEARFQMSEFYRESGAVLKRNFWLKKMIEADRKAGANTTPRARYLAAMSSMYFADEAVGKFNRAKLTLPLAKSLGKKRLLLEKSLTALNDTMAYNVAEYSTVAHFKMGELYRQLAKDLMASQRPKDLNELELEQYDILLEEQSFPFEDKAIAVHEANAKRSHNGLYDEWVQSSFKSLASLLPGRYNKTEEIVEVVNELY